MFYTISRYIERDLSRRGRLGNREEIFTYFVIFFFLFFWHQINFERGKHDFFSRSMTILYFYFKNTSRHQPEFINSAPQNVAMQDVREIFQNCNQISSCKVNKCVNIMEIRKTWKCWRKFSKFYNTSMGFDALKMLNKRWRIDRLVSCFQFAHSLEVIRNTINLQLTKPFDIFQQNFFVLNVFKKLKSVTDDVSRF